MRSGFFFVNLVGRDMRCGFLFSLCGVFVVTCCIDSGVSQGQGIPIPGSGTKIDYVGDDFEDPDWKFVHNMPKGSRENNERTYGPTGFSSNRRWFEGPERGQPDRIERIETPRGGLEGSEYALVLQTLHSGIPGSRSFDVQQDDLIASCAPRLGTNILVSEMPNAVVRVYLPPPEQWEDRTGPHFGFRFGCRTTIDKPREGLFAIGTARTNEPYWPGIWIHFRSSTSRRVDEDAAYLTVRSDARGRDFKVLDISAEEFGWWTLGMSITADGRVHYFASPGVDPLTREDLLTSQMPYGFRAERIASFFFDVCNRNDGRTWSTPFVIDDPELYVLRAERLQQIVARKKAYAERRAEAQQRSASRQRRR